MAMRPNVSFAIPPTSAASYCNGVQVTTSEWDVTCLFFHSIPVPSEESGMGATERRLVQGVVMSPQHAKALALVLQRNVASWEERNGPINLPESVLDGEPAAEDSLRADPGERAGG